MRILFLYKNHNNDDVATIHRVGDDLFKLKFTSGNISKSTFLSSRDLFRWLRITLRLLTKDSEPYASIQIDPCVMPSCMITIDSIDDAYHTILDAFEFHMDNCQDTESRPTQTNPLVVLDEAQDEAHMTDANIEANTTETTTEVNPVVAPVVAVEARSSRARGVKRLQEEVFKKFFSDTFVKDPSAAGPVNTRIIRNLFQDWKRANPHVRCVMSQKELLGYMKETCLMCTETEFWGVRQLDDESVN